MLRLALREHTGEAQICLSIHSFMYEVASLNSEVVSYLYLCVRIALLRKKLSRPPPRPCG